VFLAELRSPLRSSPPSTRCPSQQPPTSVTMSSKGLSLVQPSVVTPSSCLEGRLDPMEGEEPDS
jgi:hypothetical protein